MNSLLFALSDLEVGEKEDRTLEKYLIDKGVNSKGLAMANAGFSNTLCTTSDRISLRELVKLEHQWDRYGDGDFRLDGSLSQVPFLSTHKKLISHLSKDLEIRVKWIVRKIDYSGTLCRVVRDSGEPIYARKVVVTVPLPILKEGFQTFSLISDFITFVPSLPKMKQEAIKAIGIDPAIKILMKFSSRFWPLNLHGV